MYYVITVFLSLRNVGNNRPISHCLCACVYRSRGALFLDNRRDITEMGQTDFKPLILSMVSMIINYFNHLFSHFFSS